MQTPRSRWRRRPRGEGIARAGLVVIVTAVLGLGPTAALAAFPRPATGTRGMVASAHALATDAGLSVLKRGGNAVDAAVATAFAISVTLPYSAGIGGGGFLLLHLGKAYDKRAGRVLALDFRERAPLAATRDMYLDKSGKVRPGASTDGHLSVAVPGTVAGLYEVHRLYGQLKWAEVVAPAIALAHDGFQVSELYAKYVESRGDVVRAHPPAAEIFLRDNQAYAAGDLLVQRDLAATLRRIAHDPADFYRGHTARRLVGEMERGGGLITLDDLAAYRPIWRKPVCGRYRGHEVCSMPPPSSGGVHLVQMLRVLQTEPVGERGYHHPKTLHVMIEAMRQAYADRSEHLGDPAFTDVPVAALTSDEHAAKTRAAIPAARARRSDEVAPTPRSALTRPESHDTSHLVAVDATGTAVTLTFTVNYGFGSGVVAPGTGVLLNNEMDDFSAAPGAPNLYGLVGGEANAIAPAKIPLSSMSPTIVKKGEKLRLITGSPGGSTIITTVLQVVMGVVDYEMDAGAAVAAPRLHHQWQPDRVWLEERGFDPATREALTRLGHPLEQKERWGNASIVLMRPDGTLEGAADPRGEGSAAGY